MPHLRLYRIAFIPALAALVVLAFSLQGVPEPADPPPGTLEFDAEAAAKAARDVLKVAPERQPGSEGDNAAADLVADRFRSVVSGEIAEQTIETEVEGEDVELRNVLLTLPGASDRAILVIAGRDSRDGEGAPSSAAATGTLLELVTQLAVAGRNRTLIIASTSGASAEGQGARELIEGLPEDVDVDAAIVISQPGSDEPAEPHLLMSGGSVPVGLARTAAEVLSERASLSAGRPGPLGQIARYAIPAAAGEQAALLSDGVEAVAISSAGELPLPPSEAERNRLSIETLERIGPALLALISAIDASPAPPDGGPADSLWVGDNVVPGWSIGLLVLALLLPAAAVSASVLSAGRRNGEDAGRSFSWAFEWWLVALVFCVGIYALGLTGAIPASDVPYDPDRFGLGAGEAIAVVLVVALALWLWWTFALRVVPGRSGPQAAAGAAGAAAVVACVLVWLANPYLALILLPLAHLTAVLGAKRNPARLVAPALVLAAVPAAAAFAYVAAALDWGLAAPLQLAVLTAGGGIGPVEAIGASFILASACAIATASFATLRHG